MNKRRSGSAAAAKIVEEALAVGETAEANTKRKKKRKEKKRKEKTSSKIDDTTRFFEASLFDFGSL